MITFTAYVEYGVLNGFSSTTLYNLAAVYDIKILKTAITTRGWLNRIDFRAEGTERNIRNFQEALRSLSE